MAVDFVQRLVVYGPLDELRAFRKAVSRTVRRPRVDRIPPWRERVPLSFAAMYAFCPELVRLESTPPYDPYDLSAWPIRTLRDGRAETRYKFHTRNLEMQGFFVPLSRRFPNLAFVLVIFCLDDNSIESFLIRKGRMRRYMLPETRHERHWAQAQRRFGLSDDAVGEDDRARFFAEEGMLDEALAHWDRELAEAWRKKTKGIRTRPPAPSSKGATRQWWDRASVRDLDFERNIAIINLAQPLKARSTSHSTRRLSGRALTRIARPRGRLTRKSKNTDESVGRLAPRTIEQIVGALRRIVEAKRTHNFVICHADERKNYFVQFATGRSDTVVRAEAVSNKFLDPPFRLTDRQVKALRSMGWKPPRPKESPNFYRDWGKSVKDRLLMARHAMQTLVDVYKFPPDQELKIEVGFGKGK